MADDFFRLGIDDVMRNLDADQVLTDALKEKLRNFDDRRYQDINGIYFNRKNFFKGRWIRHGGYYPFYLLFFCFINYNKSGLLVIKGLGK